MNSAKLSVGQCATLACLLEVSTPKPGNVHRGADFEDATLYDFAASAVAIGPALQSAEETSVGQAVYDAVVATRAVSATNTNLGTILLLAPLARVAGEVTLQAGIAQVLAGLDSRDSQLVYQAIALASPGGLGEVETMDVAAAPPEDLLAAMQAAAPRDLVARQFTNGFAQVLGEVLPELVAGCESGWPLPEAIVFTQMKLLAEYGDSLIARKCGEEVSTHAAARADRVLAAGSPGEENYHRALGDFDFWLRSDGHRRNPGTTADLIAAGLFAGLREGKIQQPFG